MIDAFRGKNAKHDTRTCIRTCAHMPPNLQIRGTVGDGDTGNFFEDCHSSETLPHKRFLPSRLEAVRFFSGMQFIGL